MTQSLSNVQNGVLTRRQRRGGQQRQGRQVGQPISEVNATELIAQNPHQNEVIPSLEVSSGPTLSTRANWANVTLDETNLHTRQFHNSVASNMPDLPENPSAVQVADWLDDTVKIFQAKLPEAGPHLLANMLTGKIPSKQWSLLVRKGLTIPQPDESFDKLSEHLFRNICGTGFLEKLRAAFNALEQGAKERPSEFIQRLTTLHQYLIHFGNGTIVQELDYNTLIEKSNSITRKALKKHLVQLQSQGELPSFDSCQEYLEMNEAVIEEKYKTLSETPQDSPCDINYTGQYGNRYRNNRRGAQPRRYTPRPFSSFRGHQQQRGHWQQRRNFQRRPQFQGRRSSYANYQRFRGHSYSKPRHFDRRMPHSTVAATVPSEIPEVSTFWSMQPSAAICSVPGNKGAVFRAQCGSQTIKVMLDTGCNTDLPLLSPAFVKQHNLQTTTVQEKRFTNVLGEPGPTVNRKCTINLQYSGVCDNKPITIRETIDAFVHPCAHVDLILNLRYAIEKGITLHSHAFSYLKNGQKIQIPFATQDHQVMAALVEAPILSYDELMDQDKLLKDIDSYTLVCITQSQVPHERHDNHACLTTVSSQIENPMDGINIGIADIRAKQLLSQNLDRIKKDRVLQLPPSRGDDDVELKLIKVAKPPKIGWRMLAPDEEAYLQQEVKKLLAQGLIKPSNSKFGSHVLFVRKKDGSLRMVVDYRAINNILDDSHHNALPAIPWLLSKIQSGKRKYFSTLDCLNGYYQFRLKPSSTAVTAFQVGFTRYEWLCLPFGLRMAPSYYNRVLCNWFAEVITPGEHGQEVFVYIDDILIATDSIERHLYVLEKVFDILREKQFFLNRKKCAFFQTQVSYLGFQLSGDGITVLPEKIEAVQKLLAPTTLKEVRSLLGLFSYYRKFIPKYAHISAPLQKMVNSQLFHWDAQASIAFQKLKDAVTSAPVLRIPDWTKPFEVMVDASDYACGAVLHQCHPSPTRSGQMVKHVVEYLSHVFTKEEAKLGIAAKETFAVVYALQKFRHYLLGSPQVTVFSDNAATCRLLAQGKTSKLPLGRRQLGYLQVFGEYRPNQLILKHIPGKLNYVSDALSRCRRLPDSAPTMVSASRTADLQEDHLLAVVPFEETSLIPQFKETIIQAYQED